MLAAAAAVAGAAPAAAQTAAPAAAEAPARTAASTPFAPAITVNDSAITFYDIDQRVRLLSALGVQGDLRAQAVEQLTEDRVKVQAARALEIELPEGALMVGVEEFASQRGLTVDDVFQVLAAREIDRQTMDDFVEAGLLWREVVQSRFRAKAMPTEPDLDAALAIEANAPVEIAEISEIALPFAERGEAATLELADRLSRQLGGAGSGAFAAAARQYSRSATAAQGGRMAPTPAAALPPAIRAQVLLLGPGGVSRPIPISGGVVVLRLDALRQTAREAVGAGVPDEEVRNALREQIFTQRITSFGQGYLQELLRDALIVER
jgi:peptidyl-prolyl cis-trans isomerase SurA